MGGTDPLAPAREAVAHGAWSEALRQLESIPAPASAAASPEAVELRAMASYGNGDLDGCLEAWEQLHALHEAAGDRAEAARAAAMLAMFLMMDTGLMAPVRGWLRRAERLLDGSDEVPAHALIAMTRTYERLLCGDVDGAATNAAEAIELGQRLDVLPAVVIGRVASARVRILHHDVDEGLALLDEVCAQLMSGQVDPLTTGMMYCELICAAQGLAMLDRAAEWTQVMERWRHGAAFGGINGRCRVHRAELLRMSGPLDAAEQEALGACEELRPWMRREYGWPLVELGTIRLRKGDLDGAEEAFMAAHDRAWSPQPGLALLRLAQGDADAAASLVADAIAHPFDIPWKERPPFGDLQLAPLLDAQVEIAAAASDAATARSSAEALGRIAASYPSRGLAASASLALARAALLDGNLDAARDRAAEAVAAWSELGAPFEAAVARTVLAEACERAGNAEMAATHRRTARSAFDAFGATRHVDQLDALASAATSPAPPSQPDAGADPTRRADALTATFRLDGDTRTVTFAGSTALVRDLLGFRYLARLLADPGRELHVLDLVALEHHEPPGGGPRGHHEPDRQVPGIGRGIPVLDERAKDAYRRRLAEIDDDIDEAHRLNDTGRLALAEHDRAFIVAELAGAVGLGGRDRTVGDSSERARTSVARAIRYAIGRLAEHHTDAAAHLEQRVQTGTYCCYRSDPAAVIDWEL